MRMKEQKMSSSKKAKALYILMAEGSDCVNLFYSKEKAVRFITDNDEDITKWYIAEVCQLEEVTRSLTTKKVPMTTLPEDDAEQSL